MTAPLVCKCGARIARGYGGRLVHMTEPVGPPHYAIEAPTPRRDEERFSPLPSSSRPAAGRLTRSRTPAAD